MDPQSKPFYLGDDERNVRSVPSIEIVIDGRIEGYAGPALLVDSETESLDFNSDRNYSLFNTECLNGAITPESKNSSNASLISNGNSQQIDFAALQTTVEPAIPLKPNSSDSPHDFNISISREEGLLSTSVQVFIAFMIAGFGNVGAGLILNHVQHWSVFVSITEMFVLVPSLLGLKGNLEMTMAARLSTHANLGNMQHWKQTLKLAKGNLALVQCQATVVSFLAAVIAMLWSTVAGKGLGVDSCLTMLASSLITANVACFALGSSPFRFSSVYLC